MGFRVDRIKANSHQTGFGSISSTLSSQQGAFDRVTQAVQELGEQSRESELLALKDFSKMSSSEKLLRAEQAHASQEFIQHIERQGVLDETAKANRAREKQQQDRLSFDKKKEADSLGKELDLLRTKFGFKIEELGTEHKFNLETLDIETKATKSIHKMDNDSAERRTSSNNATRVNIADKDNTARMNIASNNNATRVNVANINNTAQDKRVKAKWTRIDAQIDRAETKDKAQKQQLISKAKELQNVELMLQQNPKNAKLLTKQRELQFSLAGELKGTGLTGAATNELLGIKPVKKTQLEIKSKTGQGKQKHTLSRMKILKIDPAEFDADAMAKLGIIIDKMSRDPNTGEYRMKIRDKNGKITVKTVNINNGNINQY